MSKILIQISGAGHSGSTLLGGLLGGIEGGFYIGEAKKIANIGDKKKPLRKRACKICGDNCEKWKGFNVKDQSLFGDVSNHMNSNLLIDSSKDLEWILNSNNNAKAQGFEVYLILLTRDGRGVVNSRIRKYPERNPKIIISNWEKKMKTSMSYFEAFKGKKIAIHYEELSTNPKKCLKEICDKFDLNYSDLIFQLRKENYHPFGGNNGTQYLFSKGNVDLSDHVKDYYEKHSGKIEPDLRWKHELSLEHQDLFELIVGEFNENFKWKEEVR